MKSLKLCFLTILLIFCLFGCTQPNIEVRVINTYEKVETIEETEELWDNDELVTLETYYEMSDGTWRTDSYNYLYRLEITGRMNAAVKDSTFVYLSNIENITFEQAWKAAGFSSLMSDYFNEKDAKLVAIK